VFAALSRFVPRAAWANLAVRPDTLLRWHRQLVMRRWTYTHRKPGRPPLERSLRELILRLAHENPHWGYKRIVGELKGLGISVSATSVRKVLLEAGLQPAPKRSHSSWRTFLRQLAASMLACDFLTVETAFLRRSMSCSSSSSSADHAEMLGQDDAEAAVQLTVAMQAHRVDDASLAPLEQHMAGVDLGTRRVTDPPRLMAADADVALLAAPVAALNSGELRRSSGQEPEMTGRAAGTEVARRADEIALEIEQPARETAP
jgi:transposase